MPDKSFGMVMARAVPEVIHILRRKLEQGGLDDYTKKLLRSYLNDITKGRQPDDRSCKHVALYLDSIGHGDL
jgi:hypothetical protein